MKKIDYPESLKSLVSELGHLPGVGPRSAERMAIWLLQDRKAAPLDLAQALTEALETVRSCPQCGFFCVGEICDICADSERDRSILCVVEQATDVIKIERSGGFRGLFHCLGGKLSPLDNVTPEDLKVDQLVQRVRSLGCEEVILALGSDVEGEATAHYLCEELEGLPIKVTRVAQGLPAGGGIQHADELTLLRALKDRRVVGDG